MPESLSFKRLLIAAMGAGFLLHPATTWAQNFSVGEAVEIEASDHWVPCVVVENAPAGESMRVRCTPYPKLSRDGGIYRVTNRPDHIRKAGGATRAAAAAVSASGTPPTQKANAAATSTGLKVGEYACYGGSTGSGSGQVAGGRSVVLAGLGFQVRPGGRYVDLDGKNPGSFTVSGSTVTFRGGIHGGTTGRSLRNGSFVIGAKVVCEPW